MYYIFTKEILEDEVTSKYALKKLIEIAEKSSDQQIAVKPYKESQNG